MNIKIVHLPSFHALSFHSAGGPYPEKEALHKLSCFIKDNNISFDPGTMKIFGRNNPVSLKNPSKRGYEFLLVLPPDYIIDVPAKRIKIKEGSYAVVSCTGLLNMQKNWQKLIKWIKNSPEYTYGYPEHFNFEKSASLELEQHYNPFTGDEQTMKLDYYFPVKKREPAAV